MREKRFAAAALAAVVLMTSLSAHAAAPTGLVITDDGYYFLTNENGTLTQTKVPVSRIMDLRTGNAPDPTPVPPDESDPISVQVKAWTAEVGDPASAQALAIVYREVGKSASGQSRDAVITALRMATDAVLAKTGGGDRWKGWRSKVSGLIDSEEAKGPVNWQKLCNSVANGLESAAPAPALDPVLLKLIIEAVMEIIKLVFSLTGGGTGV